MRAEMTNAEILRAKRSEAKRLGMCGSCMRRPSKSGRVTCQVCIDAAYVSRARKNDSFSREKLAERAASVSLHRKNRPVQLSRQQALAQGVCVACRNLPAAPGKTWCQRCTETKRASRQANASVIAEREIAAKMRQHDATYDDYARMLNEQSGACAICRGSDFGPRAKRLSVDHCHATGAVRGLLCSWCNSGLGMFKDNVEFLEAAIAYLRRANGAAQ